MEFRLSHKMLVAAAAVDAALDAHVCSLCEPHVAKGRRQAPWGSGLGLSWRLMLSGCVLWQNLRLS